jgi:phosphate transport system substrate-binding protein
MQYPWAWIVAALAVTACHRGSEKSAAERIVVDGSSTILPITQHIAGSLGADAAFTVEAVGAGTGAGFKKLCAGKVGVVGASRPITPAELDLCGQGGIRVIELPIAYDGIAVVVHPENTWATSMTIAELKKLWEPAAQGQPTRWSDLRAGWPDEPIELFGPGIESGTFDYFTHAVVGKEGESRGDFRSSADDEVLVSGVAGNRDAVGYFGFAYYQENRTRLRLVAIDDGDDGDGDGPVAPSTETIANGTYWPLARPLFLYVSETAAGQPATRALIEHYLDQVAEAAAAVGYVSLPAATIAESRQRFAARTVGPGALPSI